MLSNTSIQTKTWGGGGAGGAGVLPMLAIPTCVAVHGIVFILFGQDHDV